MLDDSKIVDSVTFLVFSDIHSYVDGIKIHISQYLDKKGIKFCFLNVD
jgi:hypothetical protein